MPKIGQQLKRTRSLKDIKLLASLVHVACLCQGLSILSRLTSTLESYYWSNASKAEVANLLYNQIGSTKCENSQRLQEEWDSMRSMVGSQKVKTTTGSS